MSSHIFDISTEIRFRLEVSPTLFCVKCHNRIMAFCLHCFKKSKKKQNKNHGVIELKNYNIFIFDISAEIQIHLEVSPTSFCGKCHNRHNGILPTLLKKKK